MEPRNPYRTLDSASVESSVVFVSPAKYDWWTWVLLSAVPLVIIFRMFVEQDSSRRVVLSLSLASISILYTAILPTKFYVLSNHAVSVKTLFFVWSYDQIERAIPYDAPGHRLLHPKIKYATASKWILLERSQGYIDVSVSPVDRQGFIEALEKTLSK